MERIPHSRFTKCSGVTATKDSGPGRIVRSVLSGGSDPNYGFLQILGKCLFCLGWGL